MYLACYIMYRLFFILSNKCGTTSTHLRCQDVSFQQTYDPPERDSDIYIYIHVVLQYSYLYRPYHDSLFLRMIYNIYAGVWILY